MGGPVNFPLMDTVFFLPLLSAETSFPERAGGNSKLHTLTEERMWRSNGAIGKTGNGKRDGKQE